jgi:CTP:molybdopterin cytidylyltransferase MocA
VVRVAGIVLAAGEGRRMGGPKALLRMDGESFLAHAIRRVSRPQVETVIAVLGHEAGRVLVEADPPASVAIVENLAYAQGMLGSILTGLAAAERLGAEAVLLQPVDHPLVADDTVDRVIAALVAGARIAVPSFLNRRGHPGGFARETWPALRLAPPERGARAVLEDHPDWIVHVPGDAGSIQGINTVEDYVRWIESR